MFKKIFILISLFFCFNFSFAEYNLNNLDGIINDKEAEGVHPKTAEDYISDGGLGGVGVTPTIETSKIAGGVSYSDKQAYNEGSPLAKDDMTSSVFSINVSSFAPGGMASGGATTKQRINFLLGTIIEKLMIALGVLSLFVMTIGAGYMIFYHGQDELLSKGKSIFTSGLIALVVALSSYYIIALVRFILYST